MSKYMYEVDIDVYDFNVKKLKKYWNNNSILFKGIIKHMGYKLDEELLEFLYEMKNIYENRANIYDIFSFGIKGFTYNRDIHKYFKNNKNKIKYHIIENYSSMTEWVSEYVGIERFFKSYYYLDGLNLKINPTAYSFFALEEVSRFIMETELKDF